MNQQVTHTRVIEKTLIGNSVCLVPLLHAAQFFPDYSKAALTRMMGILGVPLVYDKRGAHFNLYTLEAVLHYLLSPGSSGIILPGSAYKNACNHQKPNAPCTKLSVTDADLQAVHSEEWRQARMATGLNILERHPNKVNRTHRTPRTVAQGQPPQGEGAPE